MEAIELVMKIWGIQEAHRVELEDALKNTTPEHIGLALMNLGASADDDHSKANDIWMEKYLPELQFV